MSAHKTTRRTALVALAVLVVLLGVSAQALAGTGYVSGGSFGAAGSGAGQFNEPSGIAVNDTSGDVYVYDAGNRRVEWFDSTGSKFEGEFNGSGSPAGQFVQPSGPLSEYARRGTLFNLALDNDPSSPSAGDVYVVDPGHDVIDKFSATGVYLAHLTGFKALIFGVAVDTTGNVWVAEEGSEEGGNHGPVQEFDGSLANKHVTELNPEKLRSPGIALDSEQNLYLLKGEPDVVKFNKEGSFIEEIAPCGCVKAVAVDAGTNELLIDQGTAIARFGPFGAPLEETLGGISSSVGVAVNGTTHTMYASQREADTVAAFDLVALPDVTTGPASEIHRTAVKLAGEVNPGGETVTSCQFEYGTSTSYGQAASCTPAPGSGSSPVPVSAEIAGLTAGTTYHYRLLAHNSHGPRAGADGEFTTPPAVENVLTGAASEVLGTSARLSGSFEPNGFDTHYLFEYGPTEALGLSTPLEDAGAASENKTVATVVSGLHPNQTYHYRVMAENEFGHTTGAEQTLTTGVVAPVIPGAPSTSFIAAQSAVLSAALNPEHTTTRYHFEYGACPTLTGCASVQSTADEVSAVFGQIGTSAEIVGLAPATTYAYRLIATNIFEEAGEIREQKATGAESTFTTGIAPSPSVQAGAFGQLTPTSAVISGLVNPDGLPATYAFELGVYQGTGTQYGVVYSASAGSSTIPVEETLALSGLQPGTTYAYRLSISSGYITNETHTLQGAPAAFTTPGLPSVLANPPLLPQLAIPNVTFPAEAKGSTTTKTLTNTQKLTKALKACKRKQKGRKRAACIRKAEKRYGPSRGKRK
jgi:NHL repeat